MRLRVISIAGKAPEWITTGWEFYARRMPPHLQLELQAIAPVNRSNSQTTATIMQTEADRLRKAASGCYCIAMDGSGKSWSTEQLSQQLASWQHLGQDVALLIGGADGLDRNLLQQVGASWSLGKLTYPHHLVRVLLAEQLYRAHTINSGHPYHRA